MIICVAHLSSWIACELSRLFCPSVILESDKCPKIIFGWCLLFSNCNTFVVHRWAICSLLMRKRRYQCSKSQSGDWVPLPAFHPICNPTHLQNICVFLPGRPLPVLFFCLHCPWNRFRWLPIWAWFLMTLPADNLRGGPPEVSRIMAVIHSQGHFWRKKKRNKACGRKGIRNPIKSVAFNFPQWFLPQLSHGLKACLRNCQRIRYHTSPGHSSQKLFHTPAPHAVQGYLNMQMNPSCPIIKGRAWALPLGFVGDSEGRHTWFDLILTNKPQIKARLVLRPPSHNPRFLLSLLPPCTPAVQENISEVVFSLTCKNCSPVLLP